MNSSKSFEKDDIASANNQNDVSTDYGESVSSLIMKESVTSSSEDSPPDSDIVYSCSCADSHLECRESEMEYDISAKKLFAILFNPTESIPLYERFHAKRGEKNRVCSEWIEPPDSSMIISGDPLDSIATRSVKYIMPINNPMGIIILFYAPFKFLIEIYSQSKRSSSRGHSIFA